MSRSIELSANERNYLSEALKLGVRLDGRAVDAIRDPIIELSPTEYGLVNLQWGKTRLSVRVSAYISKPYEDKPFEGLFTINCAICSMALQIYDNAKNSNDEVLISRIIEKAIKRSLSLDTESLCIIAGEKVWNIQVDINFLNYDGNFIDLACFAVMVALHDFRKPDVTIVEGGADVVIHDINERQPVALSILHVPICVTYSFYNPNSRETNLKGAGADELYIVDADLKEELVRDGLIVITLNKNRELIQLAKNGGLPVDAAVLVELGMKAMKIVDSLTDKMKAVLQKHDQERYEANNMRLLEVGALRES